MYELAWKRFTTGKAHSLSFHHGQGRQSSWLRWRQAYSLGLGTQLPSLGTTQSGCLLLQGKLLLRAAEQLRALGGVHANLPFPEKPPMLTTRPQGDHMVAQRLLLRPLGYPLRCPGMAPCPCLRQKLKLQKLALAY